MNLHFRQRPFPAGNPLANALVIIVGIVVISLSLALGFVVFVGIAGFLLVAAAVVGLRNWWFGRRISAAARRERPGGGGQARQHYVIEGQYREVRPPGRDRDDA